MLTYKGVTNTKNLAKNNDQIVKYLAKICTPGVLMRVKPCSINQSTGRHITPHIVKRVLMNY